MNATWFKKAGWVYIPKSFIGYLISAFFIAIFLHDFIFIDGRAHSVSETYYNFSPYGFMYTAIYLWIGKNASAYEPA